MTTTTRHLTMAVMFLAAAGFARLGIWQLSRLRERRTANQAALAARAAPPVALGTGIRGTDTLAGRRVTAEGRYDDDRTIVLRGEVLNGVPGVRVVTPLLLARGGPAVLVDRGFLPAPDAVRVELGGLAEPGELTVRGLARPSGAGGGEPVTHGGRTTWRRLDLAALGQRLPYPIFPIYLQQTPDSQLPSFPRRVAPPPIDDGPHLNYAIQWFLFAALAIGFAVLVVGRSGGADPRT
jgi:surfeit locus 1 family protein